MDSSDDRRQLEGSDARTFVIPSDWTRQKATFTIVSRKTGARFTFRVSTPPDDPSKPSNGSPILFVHLLSGPDNSNDYRYMGIVVNPSSPRFIRTKGSKIGASAPSMIAFSWAFPKIVDSNLPESLEFWHEGACCRCGRKLTVPSSIESGIGPICAKRIG